MNILMVGDVYGDPGRAAIAKLLPELRQELAIDFCVVNVEHAAAPSEALAMGWYLDGRVSAVVGTHRHVQTADERVLPGGTAYITDLGLTGPTDGVIGVDRDQIIQRFLHQMPLRFETAKGPAALHGVVIVVEPETGRASSMRSLRPQLPRPEGPAGGGAVAAVVPGKAVGGPRPTNRGRLLAGAPTVVPCTPAGCLEILDHYGAKLEGKEAVVVGRSRLVGKPLAQLLLARHATVTMCHTRTRDLAEHTRRADVLCVAAGRARAITGDMVKEGAWGIDVGINRLETGRLVGDVDFDTASKRAEAITPVPGGAGPMTVAMLLKNTLGAAQRQVLGGELRPPQSSPGRRRGQSPRPSP